MRTLTSSATAALNGAGLAAAMLVEMDFTTVLYATTFGVDIPWGGRTWLGTGTLGSIDAIKDSSGTSDSVKFSISGVPTENIALALSQSPRNRLCKVYFAVMDPNTHAVLDAPLIWAGVLDQMAIEESGSASSVGVTAKHIGSLFSRVKPLKYTAADQLKVSPGDTSLRFITSMSVHKDIWPAAGFFRQG